MDKLKKLIAFFRTLKAINKSNSSDSEKKEKIISEFTKFVESLGIEI